MRLHNDVQVTVHRDLRQVHMSEHKLRVRVVDASVVSSDFVARSAMSGSDGVKVVFDVVSGFEVFVFILRVRGEVQGLFGFCFSFFGKRDVFQVFAGFCGI